MALAAARMAYGGWQPSCVGDIAEGRRRVPVEGRAPAAALSVAGRLQGANKDTAEIHVTVGHSGPYRSEAFALAREVPSWATPVLPHLATAGARGPSAQGWG
jgi:hypothetical protein